MKNDNHSRLRDHDTRCLIRVRHPALHGSDSSLEEFSVETTYPKAVHASIAMIGEFGLPWVKISHDEWTKRIDQGALWVRDSGKFISRQLSYFRKHMTEEKLLIDGPGLQKTVFGWGLYNCDDTLDGMTFKYIGWYLNPILYKYFERCESFEYHLFDAEPDIPGWLDAEYFPNFQALAVYGAGLD